MTYEEIVELATQAGLCYPSGKFEDWIDAGPGGHELALFVSLVEEKVLTNQKAKYYQIGYEAGVRDTRQEAVK